MALQYGLNNAVDFESSKIVSFASVLSRTAGQPMDKSQLWYPLDGMTGLQRAQAYAAGTSAYVGQELAVVDVVYEEDGTTVKSTSVKFYGIQDAAGTLKELGAVPVGDTKTIAVSSEGTISLKGVDSLVFERDVKDEEGTLTGEKETVQYQALLTKDGLVWVEPSKTTVEGLATLIDALTKRVDDVEADLESLTDFVHGTGEGDAHINGLVDTVAANTNAIAAERAERIEAIGAAASKDAEGKEVAATGVYAAIADALQSAKDYADANDANTIYDDKAVRELITGLDTRLTTAEGTIGDANGGLVKTVAENASAISAEIANAPEREAQVLTDAKGYTDEEIVGLEISIEKKTVNEAESDYIVIKNKAGTEIASVNASKFVKDGMIDLVEYNAETKLLSITWNDDAGKTKTEIGISDLVDTYTAGTGIKVENNVIAIDDTVVATKTDLSTLSETVATKQTAEQVGTAIDEKLKAYTTTADLTSTLSTKVDTSTFSEFTAGYEQDKATFATKEDYLDNATYELDKATYATKTEVSDSAADVKDFVADNYYDTAEADAKFATIENLAATTQTANNAWTKVGEVEGKINDLTSVGGEPNVLETIKVNGSVLEREKDADGEYTKTVNISVPVIANTKVSDLSDGQTLVNQVSTNAQAIAGHTEMITGLQNAINSESAGLSVLNTRLAALETEVGTVESSRIDALEGTTNTLSGTVGGHVEDIALLKQKDGELAELIGKRALADNVYTKTETEAKITAAIEAIPDVDLAPYATIESVNKEFEAIDATIATLAVADNVYTKEAADDKFQTAEQVAAIIDGLIKASDPEDGKTIENIQNLVAYVDENAGEIAALLTTVGNNTKAITKNAEDIVLINQNVAALGTCDINVNRLVQTAGDELILHGGTANAAKATE